jgi:hypothetical protein
MPPYLWGSGPCSRAEAAQVPCCGALRSGSLSQRRRLGEGGYGFVACFQKTCNFGLVGVTYLSLGKALRAWLRIPMHPAMHWNMKPAGDSELKPATPACFYKSFRMMFPKLFKVRSGSISQSYFLRAMTSFGAFHH